MHGNKSQPQRERALAGFRDGQARVLVAPDVAARGIDAEGVSSGLAERMPGGQKQSRPERFRYSCATRWQAKPIRVAVGRITAKALRLATTVRDDFKVRADG